MAVDKSHLQGYKFCLSSSDASDRDFAYEILSKVAGVLCNMILPAMGIPNSVLQKVDNIKVSAWV